MLATRLFWALGFGADRMYAVRVICRGCPASIKGGTPLPSGDRLFDPATVERKAAGRGIETYADQGWAWWDLEDVDPAAAAHRSPTVMPSSCWPSSSSTATRSRSNSGWCVWTSPPQRHPSMLHALIRS
jgi:hypothetical protein